MSALVFEQRFGELPTGVRSVLKEHVGWLQELKPHYRAYAQLLIRIKLLVARLGIALICSTDKMKPEPKTSTKQGAEDSATALARKVSFLSRPDSYVPAPETVVTRETSWVFMAGERAYKLKKPVRFSFNKEYQISATSMWVWSSRQAYHVSSRQE
jgi:hypothetical protein